MAIHSDPLLILLADVSAAFRARIRAHVAATVPGLTSFQVQLLTMIGRNAGASQHDLAVMMERDKAQIARAVKELEGHGLIRREVSAEDGRCQHILMTDKGTGIFNAAESYRVDLAANAFQDLSAEERAVMLTALSQMRKRLETL